MAVSYSVFFAAYVVTLVVGLFIAVVLAVGWKDVFWRKAIASLRYNAMYVLLLVAFPALIRVQDLAVEALSPSGESTRQIVYTNWIFSLSGGVIRVIQDRLDYRIVVDFFNGIYVWLFMFFLCFVPALLVTIDDRVSIRRYSIAMTVNYIILIAFYAVFPVSVSGSHPGAGVTPLLYTDTHWGRMVTSLDPLDNDFPSAHVSIMVIALLTLYNSGERWRKVYYFAAASAILIAFAVLYLGIHWPADVFAGLLAAIFAFAAAGNEKVQMTIDRFVRAANRRLFGV